MSTADSKDNTVYGSFDSGCEELPCDFSELLRLARSYENTALFLSGSVAEGNGNSTSDYDLICVKNELPHQSEFDHENYFHVCQLSRNDLSINHRGWVKKDENDEFVSEVCWQYKGTGNQVDLEYYTYKDIDKVLDSLDYYYNLAINSTVNTMYNFPYSEARLVHSIINGIPIVGEDKVKKIQISVEDNKFKYVLFRSACQGFPIVKDIAGAYRSKRDITATMILRGYFMAEIKAYSHTLGNTNNRDKWTLEFLFKNLDLNPSLINRILEACCLGCDGKLGIENYKNTISELIDDMNQDIINRNDKLEGFISNKEAISSIGAEFVNIDSNSREGAWEIADRLRKYSTKAPKFREILECYGKVGDVSRFFTN